MQDIIVHIIVGIVFCYIVYRAYKLLSCKPDESNKCAGCCGCALKNNFEKNIKEKKADDCC